MKIKNLLYPSILAAALVALGIGFVLTQSAPMGEQSKLAYEGTDGKNYWCVSNYIEQEPTEYLKDGRPRKDKRLDEKIDWIRKEQVEADSKSEAEQKAKEAGHGLFNPSDKTRLRQALDENDRDFFVTHFNTGATSPGPCLGGGSSSGTAGSWLSQNIAEKCGLIDTSSEYEVVKKIRVNMTQYCPCIAGNGCDCANYNGQPIGGNETTADGSGMFKVVNGRLSWVKNNGSSVEKYVFAQPQTDNIIPWSEKDRLAVVIPGFNDNKPIHVRDHYARIHLNENYLDIFSPCDEWDGVRSSLKSLPHATGGEGHSFTQVEAYVVDTTKPVATPQSTPSTTLPDGTPCPESIEPAPSSGQDYQAQVAQAYEEELSNANSNSESESSTEGDSGSYGQVASLGKTAHPGGKGAKPSFNSCHGRSVCHPANWSGHNAINGYSTHNGDALDIYDTKGGKTYAAFDGTAQSRNYGAGGGRPDLIGVRLTSRDGSVVADYVHVKPLKTGAVKAGEVIGQLYPLNRPHIHFELLVNGKVVHGNRSLRSSEPAYQKSLWNNMKKVLGI